MLRRVGAERSTGRRCDDVALFSRAYRDGFVGGRGGVLAGARLGGAAMRPADGGAGGGCGIARNAPEPVGNGGGKARGGAWLGGCGGGASLGTGVGGFDHGMLPSGETCTLALL